MQIFNFSLDTYCTFNKIFLTGKADFTRRTKRQKITAVFKCI